MAEIYKIDIVESELELKKLLATEKSGANKERIQVLYLLVTKQVKTIKEAASIIGRNRVTVQDWLTKYRQGGLENLLAKKASSGRPRTIPKWVHKSLIKRLESSEGFNSYGEICDWLTTKLGIDVKYKTVHQLVYDELGASPKIARPKSLEQSESRLADFKKTSQAI